MAAMTGEDVSTTEPVTAADVFRHGVAEAEVLIEGLKDCDPADAAQPAARLGDILSALLEAEDEGPGT